MFNYLSFLFLSKTLIAQTGDETNVDIWFIIMGAAAVLILGGIILMLVVRKKDSKDKPVRTRGKKGLDQTEPIVSDTENKETE